MTEHDNEGRGGDVGTAIVVCFLIGAAFWGWLWYLLGWRFVAECACIAMIGILVLWMRA